MSEEDSLAVAPSVVVDAGENPDGQADESPDETIPEFTVTSSGARLRAAREARKVTVVDVARALKLSPFQVEAMEADDWKRLPGATIIRGFVRNYGRFLNLDPAEFALVLDCLHVPENRELEIPMGMNVNIPAEGAIRIRDYLRIIVGGVVFILSIFVYFLLPDSVRQSAIHTMRSILPSGETSKISTGESRNPLPLSTETLTDNNATEQSPKPVVPSTRSSTASPPASSSAVSPAVKPIVSPNAPKTAPEPQTPIVPLSSSVPTEDKNVETPAVVVSENGLLFNFIEASWVEVRGYNDRVVFSQLNPAGTQHRIQIQPPFTLIVGNASGVTAKYNGKAIDLSRRNKDNVARAVVK